MNVSISRIIREEIEDYRGHHEAPSKDDGPLHDLGEIYGDDIYGPNALRYFGHHAGDHMDAQTISMIQSVRNRPNASVKIYRAVPDIYKNERNKLKGLRYLLNYYDTYSFFPIGNELIRSIENKYSINDYSFNKQRELIYDDIKKEFQKIYRELEKNKLNINSGDWVTINKDYAKEHGDSHLDDYKILTKTVRAKDLYTDGNSIHEFGYNP